MILRIACLLASDYEDAEFEEPVAAFTDAGHEVVVVGLEAGGEVAGRRGVSRAVTERGVASNGNGDFDALFIPGGASPDRLRADARTVAFTRAFFDPDRPVLAIGHGPQLLLTARVVRHRRLTASKTVRDDLHQVGADTSGAAVVVDGCLVTARDTGSIPAFIREGLGVLSQQVAAARTEA